MVSGQKKKTLMQAGCAQTPTPDSPSLGCSQPPTSLSHLRKWVSSVLTQHSKQTRGFVPVAIWIWILKVGLVTIITVPARLTVADEDIAFDGNKPSPSPHPETLPPLPHLV